MVFDIVIAIVSLLVIVAIAVSLISKLDKSTVALVIVVIAKLKVSSASTMPSSFIATLTICVSLAVPTKYTVAEAPEPVKAVKSAADPDDIAKPSLLSQKLQ